MKKFSGTSFALLILCVLFLFPGCKKFIDRYWPGHEQPEDQTCRIKKMTLDDRNAIFYYGETGNLDSVALDERVTEVGEPTYYYYKYDNLDRLVEHRITYTRDPEDFFQVHYYTWSGDKIAVDSFMSSALGYFKTVLELEYDSENRMIKESGNMFEYGNSNLTAVEETFAYDENGNLIYDPVTGYDTLKSFLRTNKVLMFTQRNYSMNNPLGSTGYNSAGLPLGFNDHVGQNNFMYFFPNTIEYDCH